MFLYASGFLFAIFVANIVIGASGGSQFLTDVTEMIVLFASSMTFTVAILRREAAEKKRKNS